MKFTRNQLKQIRRAAFRCFVVNALENHLACVHKLDQVILCDCSSIPLQEGEEWRRGSSIVWYDIRVQDSVSELICNIQVGQDASDKRKKLYTVVDHGQFKRGAVV